MGPWGRRSPAKAWGGGQADAVSGTAARARARIPGPGPASPVVCVSAHVLGGYKPGKYPKYKYPVPGPPPSHIPLAPMYPPEFDIPTPAPQPPPM
eukprot:scaffold21698_cov122-Isochrysis_galbana.AAC.7